MWPLQQCPFIKFLVTSASLGPRWGDRFLPVSGYFAIIVLIQTPDLRVSRWLSFPPLSGFVQKDGFVRSCKRVPLFLIPTQKIHLDNSIRSPYLTN